VRRASNPFAQRPSGVSRFAIDGSAERAPWMSNFRRYLLPRLLILERRGLPPVVDCLGTRPSQAARSRPLAKLSALPMAAIKLYLEFNDLPRLVEAR
jgi:hypothetical protein